MLPNKEQVDHKELVSHYCKIVMPELQNSAEVEEATTQPPTVLNMQPVPVPKVSQI